MRVVMRRCQRLILPRNRTILLTVRGSWIVDGVLNWVYRKRISKTRDDEFNAYTDAGLYSGTLAYILKARPVSVGLQMTVRLSRWSSAVSDQRGLSSALSSRPSLHRQTTDTTTDDFSSCCNISPRWPWRRRDPMHRSSITRCQVCRWRSLPPRGA